MNEPEEPQDGPSAMRQLMTMVCQIALEFDSIAFRLIPPAKLSEENLRDLETVGDKLIELTNPQLESLPDFLRAFRKDTASYIRVLEFFIQRVINFFGQPGIRELGKLEEHRAALYDLDVKLRALLPEGGWYE